MPIWPCPPLFDPHPIKHTHTHNTLGHKMRNGPGQTTWDGEWDGPLATEAIPGFDIRTPPRKTKKKHEASATYQDDDTPFQRRGCSQPGRPHGGVPRVGTVGGSDQLVVASTNQGQIGSSITTARHIPRPPQHYRNATCQSLRPASFGRSLRLCLSTLGLASGSCDGILDSYVAHLEQMLPLRRCT